MAVTADLFKGKVPVNASGNEQVVDGELAQAIHYDLIEMLVGETRLTRKAVVQILTGMEKAVFDQFKDNPEEFILKAAGLINDEKAPAMQLHCRLF